MAHPRAATGTPRKSPPTTRDWGGRAGPKGSAKPSHCIDPANTAARVASADAASTAMPQGMRSLLMGQSMPRAEPMPPCLRSSPANRPNAPLPDGLSNNDNRGGGEKCRDRKHAQRKYPSPWPPQFRGDERQDGAPANHCRRPLRNRHFNHAAPAPYRPRPIAEFNDGRLDQPDKRAHDDSSNDTGSFFPLCVPALEALGLAHHFLEIAPLLAGSPCHHRSGNANNSPNEGEDTQPTDLG